MFISPMFIGRIALRAMRPGFWLRGIGGHTLAFIGVLPLVIFLSLQAVANGHLLVLVVVLGTLGYLLYRRNDLRNSSGR